MFEILARASPLNHVTTIVLKSMHLLSLLLMVQTVLESSSMTERTPSHNAHTMNSLTVSCTIFCNYAHYMFAVILTNVWLQLSMQIWIFQLITITTRHYISHYICIRILLIMITSIIINMIWVTSIFTLFGFFYMAGF